MGAAKRISSIRFCMNTDISKRAHQTSQCPIHPQCPPPAAYQPWHHRCCPARGCRKRIDVHAERARRQRHQSPNGSDGVISLIGLRAAAKHLCQLLPATSAFFVTAPTAPLLDFDKCISAVREHFDTTNGDLFCRTCLPTLIGRRNQQWPQLPQQPHGHEKYGNEPYRSGTS